MKRKHLTYYLFGIILLLPLKINSQVLHLVEGQYSYALDDYLALTLDSTSSITFEEIVASESNVSFLPLASWQESFKPEQIYWGKLKLKNTLPNNQITEWVLKFSLILTDIEIYAVDDLGAIQISRSGFFTPISKRDFAPTLKANINKLTFLSGRSYTIYLKMTGERKAIAPLFDIELIAANQYLTALGKTKEQNFFYVGLVLMMLIYNLILYFFTRDKTFVSYSVYLGGVATYTAYNSGDIANWVTPYLFPDNPQFIFFFKLSCYVVWIGYLAFIRSFLDLSKRLPVWDQIFKWFAISAIPLLFIDAFLMKQTNFSYAPDIIIVTYSIIFVLATLVFLIPLFKDKDVKVKFIIVGIICMSLGIILSIWSRLQTVDFSTGYFKVGSILEIIAFSLGLAYRSLLNEKERQIAKFQLAKSKLIQEQEQKEAERLKELNNLKSRLYTNITHEFRTPLTVIMGINKQITENKDAKELIHRNSENLLQLVHQMLDLAKAEEGKLTLDLIQKEIIQYLRYLTESFLSAAETKNIRLNFYTEVEEVLMDYDEVKIQHIVQNLLSNAIKFTPEYGKIIFHTKTVKIEGKGYLQLKVKDSGIGISKKDLPHIFDRFYQSDNSSTRKVGGTGIGLALIQELVTLMQGKINVQSTLDKGSEFTIQLPISRKSVLNNITANSKAPENNSMVSTSNIESTDILERELVTPKTKQPLLLIIEDNEDVLTYIQSCLKDNYIIQIARNGEEGIQKALEIVPDIIISDVMMPYKDGFEVTQTLKEDLTTSHIPIILLTARATQESKLKGLKRGADAYLIKPFDKEELETRLEKLIELRKRLQTHYAQSDFFPTTNTSKVADTETLFLKQLYEVINENLAQEDFSVPQIAQKMNMSQVQVYRKLKALTSKTPSQYIRSIRMKKAMNLLNTTELNISEIAYTLGFSDPNYFSRTFQQFFGKTPSSIRKKYPNLSKE